MAIVENPVKTYAQHETEYVALQVIAQNPNAPASFRVRAQSAADTLLWLRARPGAPSPSDRLRSWSWLVSLAEGGAGEPYITKADEQIKQEYASLRQFIDRETAPAIVRKYAEWAAVSFQWLYATDDAQTPSAAIRRAVAENAKSGR